PPSGRMRKPTANTARVARSAETGFSLLNITAAMYGANTAYAVHSYHSNSCPVVLAANERRALVLPRVDCVGLPSAGRSGWEVPYAMSIPIGVGSGAVRAGAVQELREGLCSSRSSRRRILPVWVLGSSATTWTSTGRL